MSTEPTSPYFFNYRDRDWTLFQRRGDDNPAWKFAPYWGKRGQDQRLQKKEFTFRNATTHLPMPFAAALAAAKQLIDARLGSPDQYAAMNEQVALRGLISPGDG